MGPQSRMPWAPIVIAAGLILVGVASAEIIVIFGQPVPPPAGVHAPRFWRRLRLAYLEGPERSRSDGWDERPPVYKPSKSTYTS